MRLRALDRLLALFSTYPRVAALLDIKQISAILVELLEKDAVMYVWIRCILIMLKIAEYMPDEFSKLIPEV
ncbi:hypothetical protein OESDEN_17880 [Oesophagostomum dentatum]|uniref:Uncharacterized protein n=1 Tax=Oesophagostomum dentatum TaxID=61180 RepID=A0A0B1SEV6_OESDE|nr:hypothetical protein OESDEN_17880 [Oesophagostomum dentatum]